MGWNVALLVWKKILMDWWDAGGVSDPIVMTRLMDHYCIDEVPKDREAWDVWIEYQLARCGHNGDDVYSILESIDKPIRHAFLGLCYGSMSDVPSLVRLAIFHQWEHFSGNLSYPVPGEVVFRTGTKGDDAWTDPQQLYHFHVPDRLYTGEYGEKRMQLKQHAADVVRAAIDHVEQTIK